MFELAILVCSIADIWQPYRWSEWWLNEPYVCLFEQLVLWNPALAVCRLECDTVNCVQSVLLDDALSNRCHDVTHSLTTAVNELFNGNEHIVCHW